MMQISLLRSWETLHYKTGSSSCSALLICRLKDHRFLSTLNWGKTLLMELTRLTLRSKITQQYLMKKFFLTRQCLMDKKPSQWKESLKNARSELVKSANEATKIPKLCSEGSPCSLYKSQFLKMWTSLRWRLTLWRWISLKVMLVYQLPQYPLKQIHRLLQRCRMHQHKNANPATSKSRTYHSTRMLASRSRKMSQPFAVKDLMLWEAFCKRWLTTSNNSSFNLVRLAGQRQSA